MSANKQKTIDDILAQLRTWPKGHPLHRLASEIAEARERDYKLHEEMVREEFARRFKTEGWMCVDKDGNVERIWTVEGNGAAMRKALKDVLDHAAFATEHATMLTDGTPLLDRIRAAFATTARNCDVYLMPEEMHKAWEDSGSRKAFSDWLLSEVESGGCE